MLHGAGADHRETEACFEPALENAGLRRIYLDLPGHGRSPAPDSIRSADDVLETLLDFLDQFDGDQPLLVGHSAGAYYALTMAAGRSERVAGLTVVCPLLPGARDIPEHRVVSSGEIGNADFRSYFVIQTPEMLDRYERFVAPTAALVDPAAMARISENWQLTSFEAHEGPALIVAGRLDSTVGYAAAADLADDSPHATLAVLDDAGHALPHEQPERLMTLLQEWLTRVR